MALSTGLMMPEMQKKAVCMMVLVRPPRPSAWATFTAFTT